MDEYKNNQEVTKLLINNLVPWFVHGYQAIHNTLCPRSIDPLYTAPPLNSLRG